MSNGGYVMFDCCGLDLSSDAEQSKPGIYADALKAIALNKPIYAINCTYGGKPSSPVPVTVHVDNGTVIASANVLQMSITSADKAKVTNLTA